MATGTNTYQLFDTKSKATKTLSGINLIKQEVEFLLGHIKYSLFFGNNMGFSAERFLSLRNRIATFNLIRAELEKLFSKYKRASIRTIEMSFDQTTNTIVVDLTLATGTYGTNLFNVSFNLEN